MFNFFEQFLIHAGVGAIIVAVKNPDKAAALKDAMGHLVDTIAAAYGWTVSK